MNKYIKVLFNVALLVFLAGVAALLIASSVYGFQINMFAMFGVVLISMLFISGIFKVIEMDNKREEWSYK